MNDRIRKLREQSLSAIPTIDPERAILMTHFYKEHENDEPLLSEPVKRALAFKYVLENKSIYIGNSKESGLELIVGERGSAPKATPTFPELTTHSIEDLRILDERPKTSFKVNGDTLNTYKNEIIPYWKGKTIREKIFSKVSDEWKDAYAAGVFTEFMEQRSPGHTVLDNKIYKKGMLDFQEDIKKSLSELTCEDPNAEDKGEELKAMSIAADAIIAYAWRYGDKAFKLASKETDPVRKKELEKIVDVCSWVPAHAPRDFHEALQYYWFVHLGVITELNTWDSFNPGRLDQHLYPFYKKGLEDRTLTNEKATELLQAFWIKFNNQPAPPKVGVTAKESGTYTDFCLINVGGVKEDGSDAVNSLTFKILDVIEEMRLLQPSSMAQISKKNSDQYLRRVLKIVKTGFGQPSIFNTDAIIQEMLRTGKSIEDARNGGASGCVETGAFGKEAYILTGYFNLPKVLEITLNNGFDPRTQKQIGLKTGDPTEFRSFEELFEAYNKQVNHFINIKMKGNDIIERIYAEEMPAPFLSLLIDDCIKKGKDYHQGGARYNTNYVQGVGLGSATDIFASLKYNVFDKKKIGMGALMKVLSENFEGNEELRQTFLNRTPKYGNDNDYADDIMKQIFETYYKAIDSRPNLWDGKYRINLLPTTAHIYFGEVTGAMPDGRKAHEPLSEGISPVQGADRNGPTAVLKSAGKMDHVRTGGTLLNQKFTPNLLADETGMTALLNLVRSYFKMDGHHIQFNVVTVDTLRDAQLHPEKYRDLIVRVAGYSDYFLDLSTSLQEEIIKRTEHEEYK